MRVWLTDDQDEMVTVAAHGARASARGYARINCPVCAIALSKRDRKRCMSVNVLTGWYQCWRCGATGRLVDFEPTGEPAPEPTRAKTRLPEEFYLLGEEPGLSAGVLRPAREYLRGRGLSERVVGAAGLGACFDGRYAGRVIVPITYEGELLGWVGRVWAKRAFRPYLYADDMPRGTTLYNRAVLDVECDEPCFAVEGTLDALALWPVGTALLGKQSEPQVQLLVKAKRPVVVVLDGDAWEQGWMLSLRLQFEGQVAGAVRLPPGVDPDEVDRRRLIRAGVESLGRSEAVPV